MATRADPQNTTARRDRRSVAQLRDAAARATLRRLDLLPSGRVLGVGVGAGLALGWVAVEAGWPGIVGGVVVAAGAVALALTGRPIWVEETGGKSTPSTPIEAEPPDLFKVVEIDGGTFVMGSPENEPERLDNERQHTVTVAPFVMTATAVTKAQYREVMDVEAAPGPGGDDHPVTRVSWYDAVAFCNRASEKAGFAPCYRIRGKDVEWTEGHGYRLPTEAEWEYAARAGTRTRWSFGDDESKLGDYAWFGGNSGGSSHPVATRKPNPWGLFDMHGNVWEWCWDVYGEYSAKAATDPRGPVDAPVVLRVLRGGSFAYGPWGLRSANRNRDEPEIGGGDVGFRCVRGPRRQP